MKRTFIWYIAILSLLVTSCAPQPQGTSLRDDDIPKTTAPAPKGTSLRDDDRPKTRASAPKGPSLRDDDPKTRASAPKGTSLRDDDTRKTRASAPKETAVSGKGIPAKAPSPKETAVPETQTASLPEGTALRDDDNINAYNKALSQGNSAANLAQKAKTETEWKAAASEWNLAIATLKSVPKNDANYALAQQKIAEYQKNLEQAQKKTKAVTSQK